MIWFSSLNWTQGILRYTTHRPHRMSLFMNLISWWWYLAMALIHNLSLILLGIHIASRTRSWWMRSELDRWYLLLFLNHSRILYSLHMRNGSLVVSNFSLYCLKVRITSRIKIILCHEETTTIVGITLMLNTSVHELLYCRIRLLLIS